jgi:hypothetical protein
MKPLALTLGLCVLVATGSAGADQSCKARAIKQKLAGKALANFLEQCDGGSPTSD